MGAVNKHIANPKNEREREQTDRQTDRPEAEAPIRLPMLGCVRKQGESFCLGCFQ